MSLLVAGIDGGQSSTIVLVGDQQGRILSRGIAGPADEVGVDPSSTRLCDALRDALRDACRQGGIRYEDGFAAIVAGVSGYEGRIYGKKPELPTERLILMHDAPIAHAGALAGAPGVVVIAGTGSVVYARGERSGDATYGGWGYLFGDEGSAFSVARDVLALLMRAQDNGDLSLGEEARAACEVFEAASLREITRAYYAGEITRRQLAAFAPHALQFERFRAIGNRGADRLVALAHRACTFTDARQIALVGGVFGNAGFYDRVAEGILAVIPDAILVKPLYEPAAGALLLAYRELGLPDTELRA